MLTLALLSKMIGTQAFAVVTNLYVHLFYADLQTSVMETCSKHIEYWSAMYSTISCTNKVICEFGHRSVYRVV